MLYTSRTRCSTRALRATHPRDEIHRPLEVWCRCMPGSEIMGRVDCSFTPTLAINPPFRWTRSDDGLRQGVPPPPEPPSIGEGITYEYRTARVGYPPLPRRLRDQPIHVHRGATRPRTRGRRTRHDRQGPSRGRAYHPPHLRCTGMPGHGLHRQRRAGAWRPGGARLPTAAAGVRDPLLPSLAAGERL